MSSLYIQLPCKAAADHASHWLDIACQHAIVNGKGAVEHESVAPLIEIFALIPKARRIIAIFAASDVAVLQISLPPLPAAKLKVAVPNLIEDHLLCNPADCIVVAGGLLHGLRTVAAVQRSWLEQVCKAFTERGARHVVALPAQFCLPYQADRAVAAIAQQDGGTNLTLRLSEQGGMGLALSSHQPEALIQTVHTLVPEASITLYVPQEDISAYQEAISHANLTQRISLAANVWPIWIAGTRSIPLDLLAGSNSTAALKPDWRSWRWPLRLAAILLLANIAALNLDWWQMSRKAKILRTTTTQIYQARYPKETVIIDPVAQMQQKIAFAKRDAGQAAPDDFTSLAANFGTAWRDVASTEKPALSSMEYREHTLVIGFKTNATETLVQQMRIALAQHNLSLTTASAPSGTITWQIRNMP